MNSMMNIRGSMRTLVGIFFGLLFSVGILILAGMWPAPETNSLPPSAEESTVPDASSLETSSGEQLAGDDGPFNTENEDPGSLESEISSGPDETPIPESLSEVKPGRILKIPASDVRPKTESPSGSGASPETVSEERLLETTP